MQFDSTTKTAILAKIGELTSTVQGLDTAEPLQAQIDALTTQVSALTGERDTALEQLQAARGEATAAVAKLAQVRLKLDAADAADAAEDTARAELRDILNG